MTPLFCQGEWISSCLTACDSTLSVKSVGMRTRFSENEKSIRPRELGKKEVKDSGLKSAYIKPIKGFEEDMER